MIVSSCKRLGGSRSTDGDVTTKSANSKFVLRSAISLSFVKVLIFDGSVVLTVAVDIGIYTILWELALFSMSRLTEIDTAVTNAW